MSAYFLYHVNQKLLKFLWRLSLRVVVVVVVVVVVDTNTSHLIENLRRPKKHHDIGFHSVAQVMKNLSISPSHYLTEDTYRSCDFHSGIEGKGSWRGWRKDIVRELSENEYPRHDWLIGGMN